MRRSPHVRSRSWPTRTCRTKCCARFWRPARRPRTARSRSPCCRKKCRSAGPRASGGHMTVISAQGSGMDSEIAQEQQTLEDPRTPQQLKPPDERAPDEQSAPGAEAVKDQQALIAELGTSQESLDALVGELRSFDAQLEALTPERNQL